MIEFMFIVVLGCIFVIYLSLRKGIANIKSLNSKIYLLELKVMSLEEDLSSLTLGENIIFDVISKKITGDEWDEVKRVELEL